MIKVTDEARDALRSLEHPKGTVLRLDRVKGRRPDGLPVRLGAGEPRGDDQVVEHEGEDLLRIDGSVSEELTGVEIDLVETLEGPALGLKPQP